MHKVFSDSTNKICEDLVSKLSGRVVAAYIFGSRAVKDDSLYSDLDLIIVQKTPKKFFERVDDFSDIFEIDAPIDLLIYTPDEFNDLIEKRSEFGFWKSVKSTMKKIL